MAGASALPLCPHQYLRRFCRGADGVITPRATGSDPLAAAAGAAPGSPAARGEARAVARTRAPPTARRGPAATPGTMQPGRAGWGAAGGCGRQPGARAHPCGASRVALVGAASAPIVTVHGYRDRGPPRLMVCRRLWAPITRPGAPRCGEVARSPCAQPRRAAGRCRGGILDESFTQKCRPARSAQPVGARPALWRSDALMWVGATCRG